MKTTGPRSKPKLHHVADLHDSRCVHLASSRGAAGTAGDAPGHRLPRHALVLLRQPADEGVRRGEGHGAGLRGKVPAEDAQQRGLARAVGTHDADDVPRRDRQVQRAEQRAVSVAAGQAGCDEGGGRSWGVLSVGALTT